MAKKRWADFSGCQKIALVTVAAMQLGLLVAALWDLAHRGANEVRGDRHMWAGLVFINWIGPIAYFTIGRKGGLSCPSWSCCSSRPALVEPTTADMNEPLV